MHPSPIRAGRRATRCALGVLGTTVLIAGTFTGAGAALAAVPTVTFGDLQHAFGDPSVTSDSPLTTFELDNDISAPGSVLTLAGGGSMLLDITAGHTLTLGGLQLTTLDSSSNPVGSSLHIVGGGALVVNANGATNQSAAAAGAAIEVDSGSSLMLDGVDVQATASTATAASGAAIGGGTLGRVPRTAGNIVITGAADVSATGNGLGAAIGGGQRGAAGSITITGDATVHASSPGNAAAIGGGDRPLDGATGSVTISNHASVTAVANGVGAAIGGGRQGGAGSILVSDFASVVADARGAQVAIGDGASSNEGMSFTTSDQASVVAHGGNGAGIGSAAGAVGNDSVTIGDRSTITATSGTGPGIGGTGNSAVATVSINDSATVTAAGGGGGAAIGAGDSTSFGAAVTIAPGATATLSAGSGASAVGGATAGRFGSFSNSGTITLPAGNQITVPVNASMSSGGAFTNNGTVVVKGEFVNGGSITNNGTFTGNGYVTNSGAITQYGTFETAIEGSFFHIVYDSQGGSVKPLEQYLYADTFRSVGMALPSATPPSVGYFSGWNTSPDGTGATLNDRVGLSGLAPLSTTTNPTVLRVYALYQLQPVLRADVALPQGVVGVPYSASVAATSGTAPITYSYTGDLPAGLSIDASSGLITGSPTTSGTFTMHLTGRNAAGPSTHDYTIQIVATVLHVSTPFTPKAGSRYLAGGRLDVTLSGLQANESYTVTVGGKAVASGRAPTNQAFSVRTTVPKTIGDGTQTVRLKGTDHALTATSSILTASVSKSLGLKLSAKHNKVKHGKKITVTVSKLYASESVRVVISGKHGKVNVSKANAKGVYVLTLKKGLAKGKYKVTVTGAGTSRKASAKLTVS